jgi:hypothetical protein
MDADRWEPSFERVRRQLDLRVRLAQCEWWFLRGRLELATAKRGGGRGRFARARQAIRKLRREGVAYARVWADLLRGGLATFEGDRGESVRRFRNAAHAADAANLRLCAAAARWRIAAILPESEGIEERQRADDWIEAEKVRDPDRFFDIVAPASSQIA